MAAVSHTSQHSWASYAPSQEINTFRPTCECLGTSLEGGKFYNWDSCVREEIGLIKSIIPPSSICFLLVFSLMWLKTQLVTKQRSVCRGHLLVMSAHPLCLMRIRDFTTTHKNLSSPTLVGGANLASPKHSVAFAHGWLFESLTINFSVSQSVRLKKSWNSADSSASCPYTCTVVSPLCYTSSI